MAVPQSQPKNSRDAIQEEFLLRFGMKLRSKVCRVKGPVPLDFLPIPTLSSSCRSCHVQAQFRACSIFVCRHSQGSEIHGRIPLVAVQRRKQRPSRVLGSTSGIKIEVKAEALD